MADTQSTANGRAARVPEFLREPLVAAQARLEQLEAEAQRMLKDLMDRGRAGRRDFEHMVQKLSKQDWRFPEVKHRLEKLREQGAERAAEWRGRAENFRAEAMERVMDLQGRAIGYLGVATRDQVAELSREIEQLTKRFERSARAKRARKPARPSTGEN